VRAGFYGGALALLAATATASAHGPSQEERLRPGRLTLGVQAVQHTFDAMRVGEIRPTPHSNFGGRVEVGYALLPWAEVAVSAYRGLSHFDFDTAFETGEGRDSDWSVDGGPNLLVGNMGPVRLLLGGTIFYGESRSKTTIILPRSMFGPLTAEGPRTFMLGGAARLMVTRTLFGPVEGVLHLQAGVMQARGHLRPSGNLYEWNGSSFGAGLGLRVAVIGGKEELRSAYTPKRSGSHSRPSSLGGPM
jgi:hypothetical protein